MYNQFVSPTGRPFLTTIKQRREASITTHINNLQLRDVKDDAVFAQTSSRIIGDVVFKKVEIGEPKVGEHRYHESPPSIQQQMLGLSRSHYIFPVEFPFTGDRELFEYNPDSFSWSSSEHGLILPSYDRLVVYVDIPELDPEKAKLMARNLLSMTFQFVNSNNASIELWSNHITEFIKQKLKDKRAELIRVFGGPGAS
ncbi:MAG: hypothetical protein J0I41_22705 [Filimonas sp.]|nr:hypothetical protein [Filimonas sp.]